MTLSCANGRVAHHRESYNESFIPFFLDLLYTDISCNCILAYALRLCLAVSSFRDDWVIETLIGAVQDGGEADASHMKEVEFTLEVVRILHIAIVQGSKQRGREGPPPSAGGLL